MLKKEAGIYEIVNTVNGKKYVGSSVSLDSRAKSHWNELKRNRHPNPYLQNTFNKHGPESLLFKPIVYTDINEARELEQKLIDSGEFEYNIGKLVGIPNPRGVSVAQYTLEGVFVATHKSWAEASRYLNKPYKSLPPKLMKLNPSGRPTIKDNHQWVYVEEDGSYPDSLEPIPYNLRKCKQVVQYSIEGDLIRVYDSLINAARSILKTYKGTPPEVDVISTDIGRASKGSRGSKQAYGYQWRMGTGNPPSKIDPIVKSKRSARIPIKVAQYDLRGSFINVYESARRAAVAITGDAKASSAVVTNGLRNPNSTAYGFKWRKVLPGEDPPLRIS